MDGLMMDVPLTIPSLLSFAARYHRDTEVVSCTSDLGKFRYNYGDAQSRVGRLSNALRRLGIGRGDRIGTVAFNDHRHFELYFAVPALGAICHTINPRVGVDALSHIVNHASDKLIFVDPVLFLTLRSAIPDFPLHKIVLLTGDCKLAAKYPDVLIYEDLLKGERDNFVPVKIDEKEAAGLCYTSGTTGVPKGALYSHRSIVLLAMTVCAANTLAISGAETILPAVPMFHVNAWGAAHACPMAGAKLVLPGGDLSARPLEQLMSEENVTAALGVPTVWGEFLSYLDETGQKPSALRRLATGGSGAPIEMIEGFERRHGISIVHGWGMTEISPTGSIGIEHHASVQLSAKDKRKLKFKQGHAIWGVDLRLVDDNGVELPADGKSSGHLMVRGPWVISAYFGSEKNTALEDGWFRTGDIARIDAQGFLEVTDRAKDVIKSGGEWISSIAIESAAREHPAVADAAVIGIPHKKWQERPLLIAVLKAHEDVEQRELLEFVAKRLPKWWLPEAVVFSGSLPRNANGKVLKTKLRDQYANLNSFSKAER